MTFSNKTALADVLDKVVTHLNNESKSFVTFTRLCDSLPGMLPAVVEFNHSRVTSENTDNSFNLLRSSL